MAIYGKGISITTLTAGAACLEMHGDDDERAALLLVKITLESAPGASSTFGLGVPAAQGTGPVFTTSVIEDNLVLPDQFPTIAISWTGTPPTAPTNFYRRAVLDNAIGQGIIWEFPRGLFVPAASSLVVWNITAVGNATVSIVYGD